MEQLKIGKCKATGKSRYATPGCAKSAIHAIKAKKRIHDKLTGKKVKRRMGKPDQCRYYFCAHCKGFHLTSSPAKIKQIRIEKQFQQRIKETQGLVITPEEAETWKSDSLPFPELTKTN